MIKKLIAAIMILMALGYIDPSAYRKINDGIRFTVSALSKQLGMN